MIQEEEAVAQTCFGKKMFLEISEHLQENICVTCAGVISIFKQHTSILNKPLGKKNFRNLPLSLVKRHQFLECNYFGDVLDNFDSHPLFLSKRNFGVLQNVSEEKRVYLCNKFDESALLPGIQNLTGIHETSWIILFDTKNCQEHLIATDCTGDPPIPVFQLILNIWVLSDFVYFEVNSFEKRYCCGRFQAYCVANTTSEIIQISPYENLVDYNAFHKKKSNCRDLYVPVKYHLDNMLEEYNNFRNPLRQ